MTEYGTPVKREQKSPTLEERLRKAFIEELERQQKAPEIDLEYADASRGLGIFIEVHGDIDLAALAEVAITALRPVQRPKRKREGDVGTWSHCGRMAPHRPHTHSFAMNEGMYNDIQCNGVDE